MLFYRDHAISKVYFFQKATKNGKTHFASVVKTTFTSKSGLVPPKEVIKAMGIEDETFLAPKWVQEIAKHELFKK